MSEHAYLAPSAAHIWAPPDGCRAYPLVAAAYPQEDDETAKVGTAIHEAAALILCDALAGKTVALTPGWTASNGVALDQDMIDATMLYVQDVLGVARSSGVFGGPHIGIERKLPASRRIHPDNSGTPDAWIYQRLARRLTIWDLKGGYGIVEAYQNWQMMNYAVLILDALDVNGFEDQTLTIELRVVQPFAPHPEGPIRTWTLTGGELRAYANQMESAAIECMDISPVARSGSHCRYCPGRAFCTTAQRAAMAAVDEAGRLELQNPGPDALAFEIRLLRRAVDMAKHRLEGLEKQAEVRAKAGEKIPGFALTPSYGRETWKVPNTEVYALGELYDVDLRQDKPITPTQAAKLGIDSDVITQYSERPQTGVKLVDEAQTFASRVFKPTGA